MWLHGMHVSPYGYATSFGMFDPDRSRKLLLHRREIDELTRKTQQGPLTLVPLSAYFKDGRAKIELALARGRREYDKRRAIADRDAQMEAKRELGARRLRESARRA
jgi:SsrA-binding protein